MMFLVRRFPPSASLRNPLILLTSFDRYCSGGLPSIGSGEEPNDPLAPSDNAEVSLTNQYGSMYGSQLFWQDQPHLDSCQIEVVDSDTWRLSSLSPVSTGIRHHSDLKFSGIETKANASLKPAEDDPDLDEIEDMRIHGNLFYKIDRGSREFEEYSFDFHRRNSSSNKNKRETNIKEDCSCDPVPKAQNSLNSKDGHQRFSKDERLKKNSFQSLVNEERLVRTIKEKYIVCTPDEISNSQFKKKRTPTFNQLTGPYHEPFCLDIHVSKGSVRACVVHRVTSKVVVVAHSISKDLKYELGSTKSVTAAATVGKVLAQRALEDDIHDVIFTPRKGDKLEGKLQIVLQSIIDNGVNVEVKLKQKNPSKAVSKLLTNGRTSS